MADVVGRAFIEVLPNVTKFTRQLTKDLNKAFRNFKKVTVGISVGSVSKAFREITKLNTALRAATVGFALLAGKAAVAGLFSAADAAITLSGALGVIPAAAVAAVAAMGALQVGLFGVDDVVKAFLKGDMDKFNEALAKLSPNAQKALGVLKEFQPALEKFKNAVQDALFEGLDKSFEGLGKTFLPRIQSLFVSIAGSANQAFKGIADFLQQRRSLQDIDITFSNIKDTFQRLAPAGTFLSQAILDIVRVGSAFLPQIASELTTGAVKLRDFISQARTSGALENFFKKGIDAAHQLIDIIKNLFSSIIQIFRVADQSGFGFLDTLQKLTTTLNNFLHSSEGIKDLSTFFTSVKSAGQALTPVLTALFKVLTQNVAPLLASFATILGPSIAAFITDFGKALNAATPGILIFARGVGQFLDAIRPALGPLGALVGVLATDLGAALAAVGPILQRFITLLVDQLLNVLLNPAIVNAFFDLISAFGELLIAVVPLIGPLGQLAASIMPVLLSAVRALTPVFAPLIGLIGNLVQILAPFLAVINALLGPIGAFLTALAKIAEFITSNVAVAITVLAAFVVAAGAFGVALNLMGASAAATGSKLVKFGENIANTAGFLLSPFGLALTAGVAVLTIFGIKSQQAAQEQEKFRASAQGVVAVIREQNGVMNDAVRAATAKSAADTGLLEKAEKIGISSKTVVDALLGQADAQKEVAQKTIDYAKAQDAANGPLSDGVQLAVQFASGVGISADEIKKGAENNQRYQDSLGAANQRVKEASDAFGEWANQINQVYDAMVKTGQIQLGVREGQRDFAKAVADATQTIQENGKNLDVNTQKGRENQAALDSIARTAVNLATAQRNAGASTQELQADMTVARQKFIDAAVAAGYGTTEANKLADALGLIPGNYTANLAVTGASTAIGQVETLHGKLIDLVGRSYIASVSVSVPTSFGGGKIFPTMATGGTFRAGEVALVGEEGPEIVKFGSSGRVFSHDESRAIASNVNSLTSTGGHQTGGTTPQPTATDYMRPIELTIKVDMGPEVQKTINVSLDKFGRALATAKQTGVGGTRL